jgi:hypothetical protein
MINVLNIFVWVLCEYAAWSEFIETEGEDLTTELHIYTGARTRVQKVKPASC